MCCCVSQPPAVPGLPCPATGSPRPPPRDRSPRSQELSSAVPMSSRLDARPGRLCRGGVPLSPLQTFCTQGLEEAVVAHLQAGLHSPGASSGLPKVHSSLCCPHRPSLLSPLPQSPVTLPWGWRGGQQLRRVVVAGPAGGPLGTRSWGVCGGHNSPSGLGGSGGTPRQQHPSPGMVQASLPSWWAPWGPLCSLGRPNSRTKGYPAIQQQQQFTQRAGARLAPPPPLPLSPRPPRAGLEVALPRCRDARRGLSSFLP